MWGHPFTREKRSLSSDEPDEVEARSWSPSDGGLLWRVFCLVWLVCATVVIFGVRHGFLGVLGPASLGAPAGGRVFSGGRSRLPARPPPAAKGGVPPDWLTCALPVGSASENVWSRAKRRVARDLVVSMTTLPERKDALPVMLRSLTRGPTLPGAVYVTVSDLARTASCPPSMRIPVGTTSWAAPPLKVHFVRTSGEDQGPIEKYIGALDAIRRIEGDAPPEFVLVLDDDKEYDARVVDAYANALRARPDVAFTVQSPPSQLRFNASFPIAFGSRGVGVRLRVINDDGGAALADFARRAYAAEPTCKKVDDIVVSGFFHTVGVDVLDVPGFSFKHRPWKPNRYVHSASKAKRLRSSNRTVENARCHDAIVGEALKWRRGLRRARLWAHHKRGARKMKPQLKQQQQPAPRGDDDAGRARAS